jgi:hypothetical protein
VTCGAGNIRFWRVKNGNVLGQPVTLGLGHTAASHHRSPAPYQIR